MANKKTEVKRGRGRPPVAEKKILFSAKMRPSVKTLAMKFIKEDPEVKSFSEFLEMVSLEYIRKRQKVPRVHDKRMTIDDI